MITLNYAQYLVFHVVYVLVLWLSLCHQDRHVVDRYQFYVTDKQQQELLDVLTFCGSDNVSCTAILFLLHFYQLHFAYSVNEYSSMSSYVCSS